LRAVGVAYRAARDGLGDLDARSGAGRSASWTS